MPNYCIAGGCKSKPSTSGDDFSKAVTLHKFPDGNKEPARHAAWVAFVKTHRSDFNQPSASSCICSKHFAKEDYLNLVAAKHNFDMGTRCRLTLKPDAVPTISSLKRPHSSVLVGSSSSGIRRKRRSEVKLAHNYVTEALSEAHIDTDVSDDGDEDCENAYANEVDHMILDDMANDPDYQPDESEGEDDGESSADEAVPTSRYSAREEINNLFNVGDILNEAKFIVSASNILSLLRNCPECSTTEEKYILTRKTTQGAVVRFHMYCVKCHHKWSWQSMGSGRVEGKKHNKLLQASILYTGSQPSRMAAYMKSNSIAFPKSRLFYENQRSLFVPVIHQEWMAEQASVVKNIRERGTCHLGGDARCDSMGFCAQFGSYSLMDLESNKLVMIEPVSRVETANNSNAMEMEGLLRGLRKLKEEFELTIDSLVTDRHLQIAAMMRSSDGSIDHYFDCWHVSKSIQKALMKIVNHKDNTDLTVEKVRSITNRLYYMAANTAPGPTYKAQMNEKRLAMLNHIAGVHEHECNTHYRKCHHKEVTNKRLDIEGYAYGRVKHYLSQNSIKQAIQQLSPVGQTSRLESFHNVILRFAPKNLCFGFQAMTARILLAALHYNENCDRKVVLGVDGEELYRVSFAKYQHGKGKVSKTREAPTTKYVADLMAATLECLNDFHAYNTLPDLPPTPATMTDSLPQRESADDALRKHKSRYAST